MYGFRRGNERPGNEIMIVNDWTHPRVFQSSEKKQSQTNPILEKHFCFHYFDFENSLKCSKTAQQSLFWTLEVRIITIDFFDPKFSDRTSHH